MERKLSNLEADVKGEIVSGLIKYIGHLQRRLDQSKPLSAVRCHRESVGTWTDYESRFYTIHTLRRGQSLRVSCSLSRSN